MIADYTVNYNVTTGHITIQNPLPGRALEARAKDPGEAANVCGVGRISWSDVESYTNKDVAAFKRQLELGSLLAGNAKTDKPRVTGQLGIIKGLALAPHYYPNLLHQIGTKPSGAIEYVDKRWFNGFNGRDARPAAAYAGVPPSGMLTFCQGSSKYCRQTCLVTTGQNPSTDEASHAKMKFTYALLSEPALFTALLYRQLQSFAKAGKKNGFDPVVRLNMLSDLPWYSICPELLEALEGQVYFYDYTKNRFWESPDYQRIAPLLDLTYSYSGSNDRICVEALNAGHRVAVAFAPMDPKRSTAIAYRTTWKEIMASGLVDENGMVTDLFGKGTGSWEIVDGDKSDYRIDDPSPSIVALNFKQPNIKKEVAPHIEEALAESRRKFAKHVPDDAGIGIAYTRAKAKKFWAKMFGADYKSELEGMDVFEVIRIAHEYETGEPWTKFDIPDMPAGVPNNLEIAMAPVEGTDLLVGPHVPIVVND